MTLTDLKTQYPLTQSGDDFGDVMSVWFSLASYLHFERDGTPDSWKYSPGAAPSIDDYDIEILDMIGIREADTATLLEFGEWLSEMYDDCCKRGVDY